MGNDKSQNDIRRMAPLASNADQKAWLVWQKQFIRNLDDIDAGKLMDSSYKNIDPRKEFRARLSETIVASGSASGSSGSASGSDGSSSSQIKYTESQAEYDRSKKIYDDDRALHNRVIHALGQKIPNTTCEDLINDPAVRSLQEWLEKLTAIYTAMAGKTITTAYNKRWQDCQIEQDTNRNIIKTFETFFDLCEEYMKYTETFEDQSVKNYREKDFFFIFFFFFNAVFI